MQPPLATTNTTTTTYTTIPISFTDVISRSIQNLSATISRHRPWPEFLSFGSFTKPNSLSSSLTRTKTNFHYFTINYSLLITACGALSLIGSPLSLLLFSLLFALWLLLYFFREDPLVLWGGNHHVSDKVVLLGLVLASFLWVWFCGVVWSLVLGVGFGFFICLVYGVLRNPDGLYFLDEEEAVQRGLIGSGSGYGSVSGSAQCTTTSSDRGELAAI